jgi:hypothetical protein
VEFFFLYQWFTVLSGLLQYWSQFLHNCSCHFLFDLWFFKLILRILLLWVWGRLVQHRGQFCNIVQVLVMQICWVLLLQQYSNLYDVLS